MRKYMSGWSLPGDVAIRSQHTPASLPAKEFDPLLVLEAARPELVLDMDDRMHAVEKRPKAPAEPWWQIVVDEQLHAAFRLPMLAS